MLLDLNKRIEKERYGNSNARIAPPLNRAWPIDPVIKQNLIDRSDITLRRNEEAVVILLRSIGFFE
jgi:hypothetical protein